MCPLKGDVPLSCGAQVPARLGVVTSDAGVGSWGSDVGELLVAPGAQAEGPARSPLLPLP